MKCTFFKKVITLLMVVGFTSQLYGQGISGYSRYSSVLSDHTPHSLLDRSLRLEEDLEGEMEEVLQQLEEAGDVSFVYRQEILSPHTVTLKKDSAGTIRSALNQIFEGTSLRYVPSNSHIVVVNKPKVAEMAPDTVSGTVIDATGNETLPGVNVIVKGTSIGTSTDGGGSFRLAVPSLRDTLVFSFVGFQRLEIPMQGREFIEVEMQKKTSEMSEVLVTGVFERDNESFTGSHITVSQEELQRAGNDNVFQALQNIDPALVIADNLSQGSNPNVLPDMKLRGSSTFPMDASQYDEGLKANFLENPNQPLFILDGFESSVEEVFDLEMDRIQSVTILKDAAAKALYGSQAANGVIVIETKQLYATDPVITYNSDLMLELPNLSSYNLTNALEKLEAERIDGIYNPTLNRAEDHIELNQLYNSRRRIALSGLDTDWMAKPLRNGIGQSHSLSVELGSEDLKVMGNVSFGDEKGAMKGSYRQDLAGQLKVSYRIDNVLLRNSTRINRNSAQDSPYGTFDQYAQMNPYWNAENADGSIPYYAEQGPNGEAFTNPLYNSTLNTSITSGYTNFTNNFYLEWNILPQLKTTARVGISTWNTSADEYYPAGHTRFEHLVGADAINRKGSYQLNNGDRNNLSGDLNLNYSEQINKHFFMGNVGFNVRENNFSEVIHRVEGFPSDRLNNVTFGRAYALDSSPTGVESVERELGFLAVGSYMYDERYLTDLTLRTNASSQFGNDKRWAQFWSFGLGWNLHNEAFMSGQNLVDRFKIRGSLGSTGNQNFNTNASLGTYNYYLDSRYGNFLGSYVNTLANPNLQWETKFDYNGGFDAEIGNLSVRFDYYESYTENLVTNLSLPPSTGFSYVKENIGRIKNSGVELSTSYLVLRSSNGFLSLNFRGTTNKNEIIDLSDAMRNYNRQIEQQAADQSNSTPVIKYEDGRSMNDIWAVRSMGIDPATGQEIYINRDGEVTYQYNPQDMVVVGNDEPNFRGNFGFNGEYKGFGASVILRFQAGGQMYNHTLVSKVENVNMNYNVDRRVLTGRWQHPGQDADFKRLGTYCADPDGDNVCTDMQALTRPTSRFVQDYDRLDIAAINLYYNFNSRFLSRLGLRRLKAGVNMNEVATFSSLKIERGTQYPFAKSLSFSLSATF